MEANLEDRTHHERRGTNRLHALLTVIITFICMVVLDVYLAKQNYGNRRVGVAMMLAINEICYLLALRYIGCSVGAEVGTNRRSWAIVMWFIFIVIYDIKVYFVLQHIWNTCNPLGAGSSTGQDLKPLSSNLFAGNESNDRTNNSSISLPFQEVFGNPGVFMDMTQQTKKCGYSLQEKKLLMIVQAFLVPSMYVNLVGADHMTDLTDFRHLEEIKMIVFYVVVDLLDVLQLQSSMWETRPHPFPFETAAGVYFYCYMLLIVLPPISLSELSKHEGRLAPHRMIFSMIASIVLINVGTSIIRIVLLFEYNDNAMSSVFLAKNLLCLLMQVIKFAQKYFMRKKQRKSDGLDPESGDSPNKHLRNSKEQAKYADDYVTNTMNESNRSSLAIANQSCAGIELSHHRSMSSLVIEQDGVDHAMTCLDKEDHKSQEIDKALSNGDHTLDELAREGSRLENNEASSGPSTFCKIKLRPKVKRTLKKNLGLDVTSSDSDVNSSLLTLSLRHSKAESPCIWSGLGDSERKSSTLDGTHRFSIDERKSFTSEPGSGFIVSPPLTFSDCPGLEISSPNFQSSKSRSRNQLVSSMKSDIVKSTCQYSGDQLPNGRSSLSLIENAKFIQKTTGSCPRTNRPYLFFSLNQAASESDLSDNLIEPFCDSLQCTVGSSKKLEIDNQSNKSTTV